MEKIKEAKRERITIPLNEEDKMFYEIIAKKTNGKYCATEIERIILNYGRTLCKGCHIEEHRNDKSLKPEEFIKKFK